MFSLQPGYRFSVLTIVFFLAGLTLAFAQKLADPAPKIKFGVVTPDQFVNATADSTAEAVVLYDYGEASFEAESGNIWLTVTHHVRTKICKKSAYGRATLQLTTRRGTSGQHEFISNFEGYTYNKANGDISIDPLSKSGHFTEKASTEYWMEKYTLPNVHEGSIIEYRYTRHTPFSVNYNPRTWRFQQDIPVKWSEYRITIPDYFYYKMLQSGYLLMLVNEHKKTSVDLFAGENGASASAYRFAMKDIPAFRDEAYVINDEDYLAKIDFELARYQRPGQRTQDFSVDWPDLDRTLLEHPDFGGQIKRAGFLRETAKTLLSQHADTLGRITAAYEFIQKNIKWNNEAGLVASQDLRRVFENKKGDAADINLMLVALLREMDIDANPVILSTRDHGRINEAYALIKKFNYVVAQVWVGGKDVLLDATDDFLVPGMLPLHSLNQTGRLVDSKKARFVSLVPVERDIEAYTGTFTLDEDGELSGTIRHSHGGYDALSARKSFTTDGKTKYLDGIRKKQPAWQIEKAEFSGTEVKSSAFNEDYTLTIPEACGRAGDRLYFRPMITQAHTINPFKEPERVYPVDFGVQSEETFIATYTLPQGFTVEEMPKPVSMVLPENGGRFIYQVSVNDGNKLQVISRILLRKPMFYAGEYGPLRELFSRIVAKHAEQVVLKRGVIADKK
ncbi:transglutaminase domain-containing protein [Spirosoma foliorum]|uniref:DUF3857 domain-containing protein n=1 Tax=Spirosoma foliorum TaxID=2710596 RepID=A0A7G5GNM7_9BACT|nr:DUF3857 domain-containing protein [Spirosoma foliorum]QMW00469.1 DUF3857 domain-containing protein [Spirosoma foliorum]